MKSIRATCRASWYRIFSWPGKCLISTAPLGVITSRPHGAPAGWRGTACDFLSRSALRFRPGGGAGGYIEGKILVLFRLELRHLAHHGQDGLLPILGGIVINRLGVVAA